MFRVFTENKAFNIKHFLCIKNTGLIRCNQTRVSAVNRLIESAFQLIADSRKQKRQLRVDENLSKEIWNEQ